MHIEAKTSQRGEHLLRIAHIVVNRFLGLFFTFGRVYGLGGTL